MYLDAYIDLEFPPSLKHLTVYYDAFSPSEFRLLVNKLSAWTQSLECRLEFCCCDEVVYGPSNNIPAEEYIPIQKEIEALEHVDMKRFRIYERTPETSTAASGWSVRDSVVVDGDHCDDISYDRFILHFSVLNRISTAFKIQP